SELEAEHEALVTLIERGADQLNSAQRQLLEYKGLMVDKGYPAIFSPVFGAFIAAKQAHAPSSQSTGLRAEAETGRIWIDDEELTLKLSEPQRRLIDYLYRRAGVVCTYDEIAIGVWGVGEGVSPGAIYELVKRVRQKVEPDWKNPQYIVTVPGKGYRLENPS
ncbi:MAG TPA: winged helix-turn-helix domain-containing protein, partial [Anaerolineae bacterium]|nr:winged helix-turn-helix domain-containing protein [Anaerolineae bacterium]